MVTALLITAADMPSAPSLSTPRAEAATKAACPAEKAQERAALAAARSCGGEVKISGLTNELDEGFAKPNGEIRWEHRYRPARVKRGITWVPVDTTLALSADGTVRPNAAAVDLRFSGGGAGPMVAVTENGGTLRLGSPLGELPKPTLVGDTATYADVLPDVDMQLRADVDGYAQVLVVKSRFAAANPRLAQLDFPVTSQGLSLSRDDAGNLKAVGQDGKVRFTGNTPLMWDAPAQASANGERGNGGLIKAMTTELSSNVLSVTPNKAMLADPGTKYPVYIDPGVQAARTAWTMVDSGNPTTSYWNSSSEAKVGTSNGGANKFRSFYVLNVGATPIAGKHIVSSNLWVNETKSASCEARQVDLWSTSQATSTTTWNNQPTFSTLQDSQTVAKGHSAACPAGSVVFSATKVTQSAASGNWSIVALALRSPNETDNSYFKQFSNNPLLSITYTAYATISDRSTEPASACVTGSGRPAINTSTPMLQVQVTDPEGANVRPEIEWSTLAGEKLGSAEPLPGDMSGSSFATTVPAGTLEHGGIYSWRARGFDSTTWGPWSGPCEFTVDTTAPSKPTVISTDYPRRQWAGGVNVPGTFVLGSPFNSDVKSFAYHVNDEPESTVQTSSGLASITIRPPAKGEYTLFVTAYDGAGNASRVSEYTYWVGVFPVVTLPKVSSLGALDDSQAGAAAEPNCVTGDQRPTLTTETPQMWAQFTHSSATAVTADFQYATLDETPLGVEAVVDAPISGPVSAWVPQDMLDSGAAYKWRVRSRTKDRTQLGPYSDWCEFNVSADFVREAVGEGDDGFTPESGSIPDLDPPAEVPGTGTPVEGLEPYTPTPDTGEIAAETDADESDIAEDAYALRTLAAPVEPANVNIVTDDPEQSLNACPFDPSLLPTDGTSVPIEGLPDGSYSCDMPATQARQAEAEETGELSGGTVDTEVGPDSPATFQAAAAQRSPITISSNLNAQAVGDLRNTKLPQDCLKGSTRKWYVGRYDACYNERRTWIFTTKINGRAKYDGQINHTVFRYARQSPSRGVWDYHVYIRVDQALGLVSRARAYPRGAWCSASKCASRSTRTSGSIDVRGEWAQFSATFKPSVGSGKRFTHYGNLAYSFKRPGDIDVGDNTVTSNWVRCDKALKGSSSVGCVVPNYIPSLRYSRNGRYPDLAHHIRDAQISELPGRPGHYLVGNAGSEKALQRLNDSRLRSKNGSKACPSGLRARVGAPKSTSCDEYPFRSTYQGAHTNDPHGNRARSFSWCRAKISTDRGSKGYSRCFINAKQNTNGGSWVGRFYGTGSGGQRLLDGDRFYVRIS